MRSLVIQTSFLGDVILTTPLLERLAARGPVEVVTTAATADVLRGNPHVRAVHRLAKRGPAPGALPLGTLVRLVRAEGPDDVAYLAQGSWRSAWLARRAGYRTRVGFDTSAGRWLYTHRVRHVAGDHHAHRLRALAGSEGDGGPAVRPSVYPSAEDEAAVSALLGGRGAGPAPLIALAPGSAWATKRWPAFPALARRLQPLGEIVVVGGPGDREAARAIVEATAGRALDATGALTVLGSAALLRRAAVLVTNDSAPLHLASAVDTPTVALFGPTVPAFGFGPLAGARRIVEGPALACRPCGAHGGRACPQGHWRCMRDLPVERVVAAVAEVRAEAEL